MNAIEILLISFECIFNCCAVAFLLLDDQKRSLQKKNFDKNLEEIDYHLNRARTGRITHH